MASLHSVVRPVFTLKIRAKRSHTQQASRCLHVSCGEKKSSSARFHSVAKLAVVPAGLFANAAGSVAAVLPNQTAELAFDPSNPIGSLDPLTTLLIAWLVGTPVGTLILKAKTADGKEKLLAAGLPEEDISRNWSNMKKQLTALEEGTLEIPSKETEE